jgi:hypothetical protein
MDVSWLLGGDLWDQMTYTGFVLRWRDVNAETSWDDSPRMVTCNVTHTSIRGLNPNTEYEIGIAGLNEDQRNENWWKSLDLYGRRDRLNHSLEGGMTTLRGHTLGEDVYFPLFDANRTQNHGSQHISTSLGPTGMEGGEGHYGLFMVGNANIQNCNSSSFCCDSFDPDLRECIDESSYMCMSTPFMEEEDTTDGSMAFLPGAGVIVETVLDSLNESPYDAPCGPALRLTSPDARERGAAWYPRQLEVGEGFDTQFTFRLSNPSLR